MDISMLPVRPTAAMVVSGAAPPALPPSVPVSVPNLPPPSASVLWHIPGLRLRGHHNSAGKAARGYRAAKGFTGVKSGIK